MSSIPKHNICQNTRDLIVTAGLALGVRYNYAYLWYFEPRFTMKYGDYLACLT